MHTNVAKEHRRGSPKERMCSESAVTNDGVEEEVGTSDNQPLCFFSCFLARTGRNGGADHTNVSSHQAAQRGVL